MQFDSFDAFWDMGGYGFYVWLSYGLTVLLLVLLVWFSQQGHSKAKKQIAKKLQREARLKAAAKLQKQQNSEVVNESTS